MNALRLSYLVALRGLGVLSLAVSLAYANLMPCVLACGLSVGLTPILATGALGLGILLAVSRWTPAALTDPTTGHFRMAILVLWPAALVCVALTGTYVGAYHAGVYAESTMGPLITNAIMAATALLLALITVLGLLLMGGVSRAKRTEALDTGDLPASL